MQTYSSKLQKAIILVSAIVLIFSCKTPIDPDFSYSPEMPKAGEKITFTNLTEEGELWNWEFGDGSKSRLKNPTYTYKLPGEYNITLMIDSNKHYITKKKITIYDTIPTISIEGETVKYYQEATFKVLVYNPYGYTVKYDWTFSENAHSSDIADGKSTKASLDVYFSKTNVEETVLLTVQVGDSVHSINKTFLVEDVPARSLLMAQANGKILRQRMYDKGFEDYAQTTIDAGKNPFNIKYRSNTLYIFDAGTHTSTILSDIGSLPGDGSIRRVNLSTEEAIEIVHNRDVGAEHGFYNGFIGISDICWTDASNFIYKTGLNSSAIGSFEWKGDADAQTTLPYYVVKADRLGYFGNGLNFNQLNGGIHLYDNVYFWAKGGSGKGIYRFTAQDILSENITGTGILPASGAILQDYAIRAFDIDHVNKKIYFSVTFPVELAGFWVANITGKDAVRIDDSPMDQAVSYITGINIDYATNRVYWSYQAPKGVEPAKDTHRSGVKTVRLAKNNYIDTNIEYFAVDVDVLGICIDEVLR